MILVVIEQRQGKLNRMSLEALAAAQANGKEDRKSTRLNSSH